MRAYEEAQRAYQDALAYDPRLPRSYAGMGSIYMLRYLENKTQVALREQAIEYWHRSLEADPNQPRIRKLISRYQPKLTDPAQALINE